MSHTSYDASLLEAVWSCVCQARELDWSATTVLHLAAQGIPLTLERGGIWHAEAPLPAEARDLLDCLLPLVADTGPVVIAQLGQSLDGRIATLSGHSHYVNGLASRVHLHRLRALVDAVLVGAGTVAADNPRLTVRHVRGRHPQRVVLDPRGRVPVDRHVLQCGEAPTLHLIGDGVVPCAPVGEHVTRMTMPVTASGIEPRAILERLASRGLKRVLIEGGGITVSRFLEAGVVQRLHLLVAPLLIGSGRAGLDLPPIATLDQALRPATRRFPCGDDTLFDLDLTTSLT
ncbi:RibD family protein [Litchfieldella rifensis]|uniref:RibD family protein n=1 Tax=Litchfieldella rifensis TaxID=762643 RepID=A0ABV7LID2_9GAMM